MLTLVALHLSPGCPPCDLTSAFYADMETQRVQQQRLEKFEKVVGSLHHMLSTGTCAGVYNSPYDQMAPATGSPPPPLVFPLVACSTRTMRFVRVLQRAGWLVVCSMLRLMGVSCLVLRSIRSAHRGSPEECGERNAAVHHFGLEPVAARPGADVGSWADGQG